MVIKTENTQIRNLSLFHNNCKHSYYELYNLNNQNDDIERKRFIGQSSQPTQLSF